MEEITFKSIARYAFAEGIVILMFAFMPSRFALLLTAISIFVGIVAPVSGVLAYYWKSRGLRVVFQLCGPCLLYLGALRVWDTAMRLSWGVLMVSLAGLVYAGALPYMKKRLSGILYREQVDPKTRIGQWIMRLSIALFPIVGVAGAMLGLQSGKELMENESFLIFLAFLLYLPSLMTIFFIMFRYANDLLLWNNRIS